MSDFVVDERPTIFIDVDGTIVKHGTDEFLPGALSKLKKWQKQAHLVLTTNRTIEGVIKVIMKLLKAKVKISNILVCLPSGPRYLINDEKVPGTPKAVAINVTRNVGIKEVDLGL